MKNILENYRQLKPNEVIRKGDFYKSANGRIIELAKGSIGTKPDYYTDSGLTFWRRKHTAKKVSASIRRASMVNVKPNVATVNFTYYKNGHDKYHVVQLISLDSNYLIGLDIGYKDGKATYQFKKFLCSRIDGGVYLTSYQPAK